MPKYKFSKSLVILVIALNIIFTAIVLWIFYRVGHEPTSLIIAWFAFTTGELWLLAGLKKKEIERECSCGVHSQSYSPQQQEANWHKDVP